MKKNGKYPTKGMNALASKRPDVAKKIMGYQKGGMSKNKKMMGGGMMGYSAGGSIEVVKMPQEVATPKLGQTLEIPVKGHKNYKGTVKIS
jgi:hypothetical protein|tara:strand:+ start:347 stop:616 length:270 start_codon:yes stop_codon:yes gene_type:complete